MLLWMRTEAWVWLIYQMLRSIDPILVSCSKQWNEFKKWLFNSRNVWIFILDGAGQAYERCTRSCDPLL